MMNKCPYCNSVSGFYTKDYIYGSSVFFYNFDGSEAEDNSSIYDSLNFKKGKCAYCSECDKYLGYVDDVLLDEKEINANE